MRVMDTQLMRELHSTMKTHLSVSTTQMVKLKKRLANIAQRSTGSMPAGN